MVINKKKNFEFELKNKLSLFISAWTMLFQRKPEHAEKKSFRRIIKNPHEKKNLQRFEFKK